MQQVLPLRANAARRVMTALLMGCLLFVLLRMWSAERAGAVDTPMCDGHIATVYVSSGGLIVGGPDDGDVYLGILKGTSGDDVIVGTAGVDDIRARQGNDFVCAEDGHDAVQGGEGDDTIFGGGGNDLLDGGGGDDMLFGGEGNDQLAGRGGDDDLLGGAGNDQLDGNGGADGMCGGEGNDQLTGGGGDDQLDGGTGNDDIEGSGGTDVCRNADVLKHCEDTESEVSLCGTAAGSSYSSQPTSSVPSSSESLESSLVPLSSFASLSSSVTSAGEDSSLSSQSSVLPALSSIEASSVEASQSSLSSSEASVEEGASLSSLSSFSSVLSLSSSSAESCNCTVGQLWQIGDAEAQQTENPADEFNWPGAFGVFPPFTSPFVVGITPTNEFPWNSNFNQGRATVIDVQFTYAGSTASAVLTVSWAPGGSAVLEEKEVFLDGVSIGSVTRIGGTAPGWWSNMARFEDTFLFTLTPGAHTLNLQHTKGDGSVWDYVRLAVTDCSLSCSSFSSVAVSSLASSEESVATSDGTSESSAASETGSAGSSETNESSAVAEVESTILIQDAGASGVDGTHRGTDSRAMATALSVSLRTAARASGLAPGGFGGGTVTETTRYSTRALNLPLAAFGGSEFFSDTQRKVICSAQEMLTRNAERLGAVQYLAAFLRDMLSLDAQGEQILRGALIDASFCEDSEEMRRTDYGIFQD